MFCKYCGKQLEEGQICDCQKEEQVNVSTNESEQVKDNVNEESVENSNSAATDEMKVEVQRATKEIKEAMKQGKGILSEMFGYFILLLRKPSDKGRAFMDGKTTGVSVAFVILQAIFAGLFGLIVAKPINELVDSANLMIGDGIELLEALAELLPLSELLNIQGIGENLAQSIQLPPIISTKAMFFTVFMISILISLLYVFIVLGVAKIAKAKTTFSQVLKIAGIRSVFDIVITLLSMLLFMIEVGAGIGFFFIAGTCFTVLITSEYMNELRDINSNIKIYVLPIGMVLFVVVAGVIGCELLPNVISDEYIKLMKKLQEMITSLGSWESIVGQVITELF